LEEELNIRCCLWCCSCCCCGGGNNNADIVLSSQYILTTRGSRCTWRVDRDIVMFSERFHEGFETNKIRPVLGNMVCFVLQGNRQCWTKTAFCF
jgi:hypothetical protein